MKDKEEYRRNRNKKRFEEGLCVSCGKYPFKKDRKSCESCLEKERLARKSQPSNNKENTKRRNMRRKVDAINKLGGVCACCGESEIWFLTIDHINNDGAKERKDKFGGQNKIAGQYYKVLLGNENRNDLQVLCANCNFGKYANGGICPHIAPFRDDGIDYRKANAKINWPEIEELINMVKLNGTKKSALMLGVSTYLFTSRINRYGYKIKDILADALK